MTFRDRPDNRLRIFVSYARADMAATDRLVGSLESNGFNVFIDRRDLPYGEEWQTELADFIRASDTVVWLVSSASVELRWCNWELGEVQRLNKRLVPVAIEAVAPEALPEALGRIHLLPAEGAFALGQHLPALIHALNADRAWLKEHTRLAERARQWLGRDRSNALLLRGVALKDAQAWADSRPHAAPPPSDEVLDLLLASRRGQGRRQRLTVAVSLAAAIIGIGLAGLAYWQQQIAEEQQALAEQRRVQAEASEARAVEQQQEAEAQQALAEQRRVQAEASEARAVEQQQEAEAQRALAQRSEARATEQQKLAEERAAAEQAAKEEAQRNFETAKDTVDGIIFDVAQGLRNIEGMRVESIRKILARVEAAMDELTRVAPDNLEVQHSRAAMLANFGDTYLSAGSLAGARESYEASLAITERLAEADPGNTQWQHDLAVSHDHIGNVRSEQGDLAGALESYEAGLAIAARLAATDPGNAEWQRDLEVSHLHVGDIRRAQGDLAGALESYAASLPIAERLAANNPDNTEWQRDLALAHERIGAVHLMQADPAAALESFEKTLSITERLSSGDPDNVRWLRGVALAHNEIGDARQAQGDLEGARQSYEQSLTVRRHVATLDSEDPQGQIDVVAGLYKIATVSEGPQRIAAVTEALEVLRNLQQRNALGAAQELWPAQLQKMLAEAKQE